MRNTWEWEIIALNNGLHVNVRLRGIIPLTTGKGPDKLTLALNPERVKPSPSPL